MLTLLERALKSSSSNQDDVNFFTAIVHIKPLRQDNYNESVKEIQDLIASNKSRLRGLYMLDLALQQNFDIYHKANWTDVLITLLKEPSSIDCKEKICNIISCIIQNWAKDPIGNQEKIASISSTLYPLLLKNANSDVWKVAAFQCLTTVAKNFPLSLIRYKEELLRLILKETCSVSTKHFEVYAECFSYIPAIQKTVVPEIYIDSWASLYKRTLDSMKRMLNSLLTFISDSNKFRVPQDDVFEEDFADDPDDRDGFSDLMLSLRRFMNFCTCLSKMLSTKSKHVVQVPIEMTLDCIRRVFMVDEISKLKPTSLETQVLLSCLSQLQIAALCLLEPLLTNFGSHVVPFTNFILELLRSALLLSKSSNIAKEPISQIRHAVWKLMQVWLGSQGGKGVACRIIKEKEIILKELLNDISIQEKPPEVSVPGKSKKSSALNETRKNNFYLNEDWSVVCKEALKALKKLLYGGGCFLETNMFQEMSLKLFRITYAIHPTEECPFPYTNEECRKNLYNVLLALTIVSKPTQIDTLQHAIAVFENAKLDSSNKVTSVCSKASATCRLALHPKKPPPLILTVDSKPNVPGPSRAIARYQVFSAEEDAYIENLPAVKEEVLEDMPCRIAQSYHPNDSEIISSDYAQSDAPYSEQTAESQCNGDEMMLEVQDISQNQEDEESEEDGEASEEEDEDRSFDDDEIIEEVQLQPQHLYIPSTGDLHAMTNVHIVPETVQSVEPQYEELRPGSSKVQGTAFSSSSSKKCVNGVHNSMPNEEAATASEGNLANENGIYGSEEEDVDEEEGDEDNEGDEEDEVQHRPAEKRVPDSVDTTACKKQKMDSCIDVEMRESQDEDADPRSMSPDVEQMKKDFIFSDGEDVEDTDVKTECVKS